jgi:hypothetical protein
LTTNTFLVEEKRTNKNGNTTDFLKADKNACHGVSFLVYNPRHYRFGNPQMFRNLGFNRVTSPWPDSEQELSELLSENTFSPGGSFAGRSQPGSRSRPSIYPYQWHAVGRSGKSSDSYG